jgi:ABC-type antimicrobial peptide transport system, permease component
MNFIKNIWSDIKEQPMLSGVSIIGTALAIFLIMVVVMLQEVKVAPFAPESNRERLLYADYASIYNLKDGPDWNSNGGMSVELAERLYKDLTTAEAVSIYVNDTQSSSASLPGQPSVTVDTRLCDADFFKVFDYTFISGAPFSRSDSESGIKKAVITDGLARKIFGRTDVVGEELMLFRVPYVVCGVVKNVSTVATKAYADAWIPYSTSWMASSKWNEHMGMMSVVILAKDGVEHSEVKEECNNFFNKTNDEIEAGGWRLIQRDRPYDQETQVCGSSSNRTPDLNSERKERIILLSILLIVPAINLSCMTHSRLSQRRSEVGVKRAFGATRGMILNEVLAENMVVTLVAGVIGFMLSIGFAYMFSSELFTRSFVTLSNEPTIELSMLVHASTFLWVLIFCFLLNVLSAGLPAWQASRVNVVNAIKG